MGLSFLVLSIILYAACTHAFTPLTSGEDRVEYEKSNFVSTDPLVTENRHYQVIDHFSGSKNGFWQRYLENKKYYKPGGPLICLIGGQELLVQEFITNGTLAEIAEAHNAWIIYPEHRYFGLSRPFKNTTMENLRYLNVDQVLADVAHIITAIKKNETELENAKVLVAGFALSGSYVSWFRLKYPELSVGGWASSAPINIIPFVTNYREEMGKIIKAVGGEACYKKLDLGFEKMEDYIIEGHTDDIMTSFKLCHPFDSTNLNDGMFFFHIIVALYSAVIAGQDEKFLKEACDSIVANEDPIKGVAAGLSKYLVHMPCINTRYNETVQNMRNTTLGGNGREFMYLGCQELGWFTPGTSKKQPFGNWPTTDFYVQLCRDVFQDNITANSMEEHANRLNKKYGGLHSNFTNVFTTQGQWDPVKVMGLNHDLNPTSPTKVIAGATHANDFLFYVQETKEIHDVKLKLKSLVSQWLK